MSPRSHPVQKAAMPGQAAGMARASAAAGEDATPPDASTTDADAGRNRKQVCHETISTVANGGGSPLSSEYSPTTLPPLPLPTSARCINHRFTFEDDIGEFYDGGIPAICFQPGYAKYALLPNSERTLEYEAWAIVNGFKPALPSLPAEERVVCIGCGARALVECPYDARQLGQLWIKNQWVWCYRCNSSSKMVEIWTCGQCEEQFCNYCVQNE
jgi:hypothetical protein